jgi:peptide-methionine (S)-S-oxide reductase
MTPTKHSIDSTTEHSATLAGGCFWCLESIFDNIHGVLQVISGYTGGSTVNPTYQEVCAGITGHAECIQLSFLPQQISYQTLLEVFFAYHDPTTLNRQGNDTGTQYRSAIYTHDDHQSSIAQQTINSLALNHTFEKPVVTEVTRLDVFYKAEPYHQQYFSNNPINPYCNSVITPKLSQLRQQHAHLIKSKNTH